MATTEVTGWVGWGWFAALLLLITGVFNALYGLLAIIDPESAYFVPMEGSGLAIFDLPGWGWWMLITGIALILVAAALFRGATWARVVAIILVAVNAIEQLFLIPAQPWLALIVLALDMLMIYALAVHGDELRITAR